MPPPPREWREQVGSQSLIESLEWWIIWVELGGFSQSLLEYLIRLGQSKSAKCHGFGT